MDQILENAIEGLDEMLNSLTGLDKVSGMQNEDVANLGGFGLAASEMSKQSEVEVGRF